MRTPNISAFLICTFSLFVITALSAPGCALLSKNQQDPVRFFSLVAAPGRPAASEAPKEGAELRLGHVTGATHLEERLIYRDSAYEINYYRDLRWTEPPELCLKRWLARVLFEERGLTQVVGGASPTLDVQLTAFDEILSPNHLARAKVIVKLHDEHLVLWEETVTVERPIIEKKGDNQAVAAVEALGAALQAVVDLIADRVELELQKPANASNAVDKVAPPN